MNRLQKQDLKQIRGGFSGWLLASIVAACIFIAGVFDGITRPVKCGD